MATDIRTFCWTDCYTVDSCSVAISFPFDLDCHWHPLVHTCERLCRRMVRSGVFSYCGLVCISCIHPYGKVVNKKTGTLIYCVHNKGSLFQNMDVLVDLVRVPDWAIEAAGQEMRGMGQDAAAYQPGLYLCPALRSSRSTFQELPKFTMKAVPIDCSECPICLEEFHVGNEGYLHFWKKLGVPFVFPRRVHRRVAPIKREMPEMPLLSLSEPDLSALSNIQTTCPRPMSSPSQSYMLRLQGLLHPVRMEHTGSGSNTDTAKVPAGTRVVDPIKTVQAVVQRASQHRV
ncbi:hypothetical protein CASFOL_041406 [Castilleja foliolosa]|uniref:Uncharacterized protein n=1 Tax=Castilleja foliolosa TaxID=1961234 RepID=A0ABD3BBJ6_9LAMI